MSGFFIERPIFAWVLAILLMMMGGLAVLKLPVAQYPNIAPPQVVISASWPGADAKTVEDSVAQVIEQNMNGLDNLLYMASNSDSSGNVSVTLTFDSGTDPDIAQVQVQNKLQLAMPLLPQEVQQQGISVKKSSSGFLMVLAAISQDGSMDQNDLADFIASTIKDPVSRTAGVGDVQLFGAQYAMRVWLKPHKLWQYQLTTSDVLSQIKAQNNQIAAGQLGGAPAVPGQQLNASIIVRTRLTSETQFGHILLKTMPNGASVRLDDVADISMGGENYNVIARFNGKPSAGLGIKLATGANALDTAKAIRAQIDRMRPWFPQGVKLVYTYDTTPFITLSIQEVFKTLFEAIVLVFLVMFLFLQNLRATFIPTMTVPIVLLGTFAILLAMGYSINTLTMFGMVLAIGLLVDDAIVVVENVERVMAEEGLSPKAATHKSMKQIQGALVGIAMVLSAVFVPMAFFGGSTGVIYRQFSVTIVASMLLSVLVAMIFTPALCATLLKPHQNEEGKKGWAGIFNRKFARSTEHYCSSVRQMLGATRRYMVVWLLLCAVLAGLFLHLPSAFLPEEDQGVFLTIATLPPGATQGRTQKVLDSISRYYLTQEKNSVESVFTVNGFGLSGRGQNNGLVFVRLKPWEGRQDEQQGVQAIVRRATHAFRAIQDGMVFAFNLPAITELGTSAGFDMELIDRSGVGHQKLMAARNALFGLVAKHPDVLVRVRPNGLDDTPQLKIDVDEKKAQASGVSVSDVDSTFATVLGSSYVNDFVDRGRIKKVYVQGDAAYRMLPEQTKQWYVRSNTNEMVPLSSLARTRWISGSPRLERYNGLSSLEIQGEAVPGKSTGDAMQLMEALVKQLPGGVGAEWTGMSYQERLAGHQALWLYLISMIVVFLCLAALYESWSVPVAVILVVPLGVFGAVLAAMLCAKNNDIYFQVGLLTTIGLSAKNAILIVEFAKELLEKEGYSAVDAVLEAVRMRLRPILMTSLAFILGVLPLVLSSGAGAGARKDVGIGVLGGMTSATLLAIYFVPVFFIVVNQFFCGPALMRNNKEALSPHS
ncbi:efflux RND transporter permease subunit [unidentified bacterial endosymbiont]|jgi:multidrug efflux pump|uniref:efflux RND transporter permease subunit n=1 Tax=unidentified bacterial endosymbiont TaxID=2355 RepID=UPI0020A131D0|nr:efflux RND transporter permease subunit [unidentified bacterial endosymbiont]